MAGHGNAGRRAARSVTPTRIKENFQLFGLDKGEAGTPPCSTTSPAEFRRALPAWSHS
jgi:hypothetical protein